jgi:hypothetical protein
MARPYPGGRYHDGEGPSDYYCPKCGLRVDLWAGCTCPDDDVAEYLDGYKTFDELTPAAQDVVREIDGEPQEA